MGAVFHCETFDGKLTADQVRKQYLSRRDDMEYEYGADAYNGTWSTLDSHVVIHNEVLDSHNAAHDFLDKRAEKRGAAHAVRYRDVRTETTKEPTFHGKPRSFGEGLPIRAAEDREYTTRAVIRRYSSTTHDTGTIAAEQLKPADQEKLIAAATTWREASLAFAATESQLAGLLAKIKDPCIEIVSSDFAMVKELRKLLNKQWAALSKAANKLYALDKKHGDKLYSTAQVDHGTHWLVGGLCAE